MTPSQLLSSRDLWRANSWQLFEAFLLFSLSCSQSSGCTRALSDAHVIKGSGGKQMERALSFWKSSTSPPVLVTLAAADLALCLQHPDKALGLRCTFPQGGLRGRGQHLAVGTYQLVVWLVNFWSGFWDGFPSAKAISSVGDEHQIGRHAIDGERMEEKSCWF